MTGFPQVKLNPKRLTLTIFFISLLHVLLPITSVSAYNATDFILLDCGSPSKTTSPDGRSWDAFTRSIYSTFTNPNSSFSLDASRQDSSVPRVPYFSALIIQSKFTYSFHVSPGPKFLRLYFYPDKYSTFDMTTSFFSVTANSYILLKNFSAHMHLINEAFLMKEFIVPVWDNEILNVTFIPSSNSYAFINGIEIVSMPSGLYLSGRGIPFVTGVVGKSFSLDDTTTSLETLYRLNVGGQRIENVKDTGMYRIWSEDGKYLVGSNWTSPILDKSIPLNFTATTPEYTAPKEVYTTSRMMGNNVSLNLKAMTWKFSVDAGFFYLVRLHFCELYSSVTGQHQHVFDIFINNQTAKTFVDVIFLAGGIGIPMYLDYIVLAEDRTQGRDLWLSLQPQRSLKNIDAFLNGLEIFKLSQSDGNLAGPNPESSPAPPNSHEGVFKSPKSKVISTILPIIGAILASFALFSLLLGFLIFQRRRKLKDTSKLPPTETSPSLPSNLCRRFSITQIKTATQDFNDQYLIGIGGFGHVYVGTIDGETTTVAIKRLKSSSRQGAHEFHTEITMLSKLRHMHLVSLIGYCDDKGEMILVYEYMPRGTLQDHLYQSKSPPLSWKQRLEICIGAARGLHYLHREAKDCIIHRDVKSSNILLDENYVAKVSDFGLSKLGPTSPLQTHVSTVVKGSIGYLDPEYYLRQHLTEKSDVYSFGVVLFEVLCARPPVIQGLSKEKVSLANWARLCYLKGTLDEIIDPYLKGQIAPTALHKFGEVAEKCVRDKGMERPTMSDIVWALEFTLQLQETEDKKVDGSDAITTDEEFFSGSTENVAKSQQLMSDTTSCSTTVSELSSKTKILEKDTSKLIFGDEN